MPDHPPRTLFRLGPDTLEGLARIARARGLAIDRSAFRGEPNRTEALRQIVAEEVARLDITLASKPAGSPP